MGHMSTAELTVPARPESVRVLRLIAADAAAAAELGFDRYSDLELAVDEAAALLLPLAPTALACRIESRAGRVDVTMSANHPSHSGADFADDELATVVLGTVTDAYRIREGTGGEPSVEFHVAGH